MKIGILGGTFDPIHNGHIDLAYRAIEYGLDKIIFIPAGTPVGKTGVSSADVRAELVKLAIADEPRFNIDLFEVNRTGISYTIDTIKYLKEKYPNDDLYFICGEDVYNNLSKFKDAEEIQKLVTIPYFSRTDVSSTKIRTTGTLDDVPTKVAECIKHEQLSQSQYQHP